MNILFYLDLYLWDGCTFCYLSNDIVRKAVGIIIDHSGNVDVAVIDHFSKQNEVKVQTSNERKGKANTTRYCAFTLYELQVYERNSSYQDIKHTL